MSDSESSNTHLAFATKAVGVSSTIHVPTLSPGPGGVMVKVAYSTIIPLDTYMVDHEHYVQQVKDEYPAILGFNVSGVVETVGDGVEDLVRGDKVCGFATVGSKGKGLQEYAILNRFTCAKLPDGYSLKEAATIPDNFITAYYTLFTCMGLSPPTFPLSSSVPSRHANAPILVYGAGSTSGQYAVQLLALAGYKRIVAAASPRHHSYLKSLGATHVVDYNTVHMAQKILHAAGGIIQFAVDCISTETTLRSISSVVSPEGVVAMLLPVKEGNSHIAGKDVQLRMNLPANRSPFPYSVKLIGVKTLTYLQDEYLRENLMRKILPQLLKDKIIKPNHIRLFNQGSLQDRCQKALNVVRNGQVSGEKVVVEVTPMV